MKIAFIKSQLDVRGGGNRFVYETALRMQNLGHEVMIFCNSMDASKTYPEMLEIPHKVFKARRNLLGHFNAYFILKALKKLIEEADKWRPDIIFLQEGSSLANYFQKITRILIVPYFHGSAALKPYEKNWIKYLYRKILSLKFKNGNFENVPLILCNSHYTERLIRELAPDANIKVIYPGVDHNRFKPTWEEKGYLFYHSRICPQKNQLLAIQAVRERYPLFILGSSTKRGKKYSLKVQNEAKKYGHKILTDDSKLIPLLQNCSIFLFPAIRDSFGIAPIEAMACGKPIIAHNSGGVIETVGKVGILCGDNVEEWREKIDYLMENPDIRKELGKKSYEFSKKFTWENAVKQLLEAFREVL